MEESTRLQFAQFVAVLQSLAELQRTGLDVLLCKVWSEAGGWAGRRTTWLIIRTCDSSSDHMTHHPTT